MDVCGTIMDAAGGISGHEGTLTAPRFDQAGLVHDWRNHVPAELKWMWSQLSTESRAVAYFVARQAASAEEWE